MLLPARDLGNAKPWTLEAATLAQVPELRAPPLSHVSPRLGAEALQPCGQQPAAREPHFQRNRSRWQWQGRPDGSNYGGRGEAGEVGARRGWEGWPRGRRAGEPESRRVAEGPVPPAHRGRTSKAPVLGARVPQQAGRDGGFGSAERWGSGQHKELCAGSQEAEVVVCLVTNALWP